ncbi:unnamed protein product [Acanthoscelides obtectus]|uniref:Uncharacterized protein n=1 Tax=Acanthoscelides obtectus TaxID=200917 RepID=A0A9P0LEI0_ACAOB|nr:unnamed protein product [Acanthoscelides obtectus]CAK1620767.1 hypothetical protein AOBTE_LOCUS553 [Acanthoscelides obtectus]
MSLEINGCDTVENKLKNYFIKSVTDIVSTIPSGEEEAITAAVPLEEEFWRFQEITQNCFSIEEKIYGFLIDMMHESCEWA